MKNKPAASRISSGSFFVVIALAFLASLVLNVSLLSVARNTYADTLVAQIWPAASAAPSFIQPGKPGLPLLVLLGDSRMAEWGLPEVTGFRVANWSVGGSTSGQTALRCREMLAQTKPHTVVLQVGINDLKLLGLRPELRRQVIDTVASNTVSIVEDCRQAGADVIVLPVWPTGSVDFRRRMVWSDEIEKARLELSSQIEKLLAQRKNVRVLDLFQAVRSIRPSDGPAVWFRDTLHLKPEVYGVLTRLLSEELKTNSQFRPLPAPATLPQ